LRPPTDLDFQGRRSPRARLPRRGFVVRLVVDVGVVVLLDPRGRLGVRLGAGRGDREGE